MDEKRFIRISKFLSKHLRHKPENIGLHLDKNGWVMVEELLQACQKNNFPITFAEIEAVVVNNDKQRFAFDETKTKIRANQGHSIEIDLDLSPEIPPEKLYHGTALKNMESILKMGLKKMARHHVHLAPEHHIPMTIHVAKRHGKPVLLEINAQAMVNDGFVFYVTENEVWLVDHVPAVYLKEIPHD